MKKKNVIKKANKFKEIIVNNKKLLIKVGVFVVSITVFCCGIKFLVSDEDGVPKEVLGSSAEKTNEKNDNEEEKDKNEEKDDSEEQKDIQIDLDSKYEAMEKDKNVKKAYLTFDDGPSDNTMRILDILDKNDVKATFFVKYNQGYENEYREIVKRGHQLALHTYTHEYSDIYSSKKAYFDDLNKIHEYVKNTTGVDSNLVRFPGGSNNSVSKHYCQGIMSELVKELPKKGFKYFDWNADSTDASGNGVPVSQLLAEINKSSDTKDNCVLMHDTNAKNTTVDALPEIIKHYKSKGYKCIPITSNTKEFHFAASTMLN